LRRGIGIRERAGEPAIWEARLRTAKELEAEAARAEAGLPSTPRTLSVVIIAPGHACDGPTL